MFKYSRETDTMKEIENFVLQATIEHFQYFNFHEVEDLTIVDVSTVVIKRKFLVELTELSVMVGLAFDFFDRSNQIFGNIGCFFISQSRENADTLGASALSLVLLPSRRSASSCSF